jgi:hypothetical protein
MDDFVAELDACLAWDGAPDEQDTMVVAPAAGAAAAAVEPRTGPERERAPRPDAPPRRGRVSRRRLAWLLLVATIAAGAVALILGLSRGHGPATPSASAGPVHLTAAASYNPEGTGPEDSQGVPLATDGNTATSWTTEYYATQNFGNLKSGDGLLLEVSRPVVLSSIRVVSDTPGFTALIKAGPSPTGPFTAVSDSMTAGRETVFTLNVSAPVRYYVIWFTNLSPLRGRYGYHIDINEVTAT